MDHTEPPTRGESTRARLLDAAAIAFAENGYHGTSYADLIAATGLSKGACFHHFRSKKELAVAVIGAKQQEMVRRMTPELDPIASPLARFLAMLRLRARLFTEDRGYLALHRLSADLAHDAETKPRVVAGHRFVIGLFAGMLADARAAHEIRADVEPEAAARATFAALVGLDELAERETRGADRAARTEDLIALLSAALAAPVSPSRRRAARRPARSTAAATTTPRIRRRNA